MPQNVGNIINGTQAAFLHGDPGWVTVIWHGVALIGLPAKEWAIRDSRNQPLVVTAGNKIRDIAFTTHEPCVGTTGDRIKVAGSVTDTNAYVCQSLPVDANGFLVDQGQQQLADFTLVSDFTPKLFLHTGNAAPANTLQGTNQTPTGPVTPPPNAPQVRPVRVDVRVVWQELVGAPSIDDGILLSREQEEALNIVYRSDLLA